VSVIEKMWAALEAHKPAPEYAEAWQRMCRERTEDAAWAAHYAAPEGSAAWWAAAAGAAAAWAEAARVERYAQDAIDAMREVDRPARRAIAALRRVKP
jgi:hypothetical protein